MTIPYATATSGMKAREEVNKILRHFGAESVGWMDEFETKTVLLAFVLRGTPVQLRASAQGWANAWMKQNPYSGRMRLTRHQYEERALRQGMIAVNSILRDWVKGQVTAIETGVLTFEHVFMPYMLTHNGQSLADVVREQKLLTAG